MTTAQPTITLSLADARKLAAGELREVLIAVKPAIGHRQQILPLNRGWMLCDETVECPSDGTPIRAPHQPGDVLAVKEPWTIYVVSTVRHWLRVTACEPVRGGGKWRWRVGVEKVERSE